MKRYHAGWLIPSLWDDLTSFHLSSGCLNNSCLVSLVGNYVFPPKPSQPSRYPRSEHNNCADSINSISEPARLDHYSVLHVPEEIAQPDEPGCEQESLVQLEELSCEGRQVGRSGR
jgi:hypothetical protein